MKMEPALTSHHRVGQIEILLCRLSSVAHPEVSHVVLERWALVGDPVSGRLPQACPLLT